jgi:hypothetical protein
LPNANINLISGIEAGACHSLTYSLWFDQN